MNERTHRIRYHSEAVHGGRLRVFSTQRAGIQMVLALVMFVFIMAVGACGSSEDSPPVEVDAPLSLNGSAPMAHGDHSAKHGGFVYMHGDLHYEVLLSGDGHHQIYLSDATRVDLPASAIANAVLEIPREGGDLEVLELAIDDFGESWEARGAPITDSATVATLRFSFQNEPYEIELPFVPPADADVMNPHTGKQ